VQSRASYWWSDQSPKHHIQQTCGLEWHAHAAATWSKAGLRSHRSIATSPPSCLELAAFSPAAQPGKKKERRRPLLFLSKQHSRLRGQPTTVPAVTTTSFFPTIGATLCCAGSRAWACRLLDIFYPCCQPCCRLSIRRHGRSLHLPWRERSCGSREKRRLWHT